MKKKMSGNVFISYNVLYKSRGCKGMRSVSYTVENNVIQSPLGKKLPTFVHFLFMLENFKPIRK